MKSRRRLHYAYEYDDEGRLIGHAVSSRPYIAETVAKIYAQSVLDARARKQAKADAIRDDAGELPEGGVDLF